MMNTEFQELKILKHELTIEKSNTINKNKSKHKGQIQRKGLKPPPLAVEEHALPMKSPLPTKSAGAAKIRSVLIIFLK
jgi:hypothetical protein